MHAQFPGCRQPELYAEGKSGAEAAEVGRSHIVISVKVSVGRLAGLGPPTPIPSLPVLWMEPHARLLPCYVPYMNVYWDP